MRFKAIIDLLEKKLGVKLKVLERNECELFVFNYEDTVILVGCSEGSYTEWKYCKIIASEKLGTSKWSCLMLEYNPWGYYCFGKSIDEVTSKILNKLNYVVQS